MLLIHPYINNKTKYYNFNKMPVKKREKENYRCLQNNNLAFNGLLQYIKRNKKNIMTNEEMLKKFGVEIVDGLAVLKENGEKFSGKMTRRLNWNEKETVKYDEGKLSEKIYHNLFGRELNGEFYKDGKICMTVTGHSGFIFKSFAYNTFKDGVLYERGDVFSAKIDSVFDWARDIVKQKNTEK